eukprot:scaffold406_cov57-Cylindrotheca_fusiformis.AAC.2
MSSTIEARLARLEAAIGLTVPPGSKKGKVSNNNDDEKLVEEIYDQIEHLEQKVTSNQELIDDKLGEIISCLAELKSETKSEAISITAAKEIQTVQPTIDAKAANRQRIIESAILANRQDMDLISKRWPPANGSFFDFRDMKFSALDLILKSFQQGQPAILPKASNYFFNAPRNDEELNSYFVNAIHKLTGTKPITRRDGWSWSISYPE